MIHNSYITSISITNILLILFTKETDYRQGLDYNILTVHIHSIFWTYLLTICLIICYLLSIISLIKIYWIEIINKLCLASSINLICSGGLWSWSQWGTIQLYDIKVLITMILIIVFGTVNIIIYISKKINSLLFFYNTYILYHIPLLKYNVVWNSEIHQKSTFTLVDFFMVNYNSAAFIILCLLVVLLYILIIRIQKKRSYLIKNI